MMLKFSGLATQPSPSILPELLVIKTELKKFEIIENNLSCLEGGVALTGRTTVDKRPHYTSLKLPSTSFIHET